MVRACRPPAREPTSSWPTRRSTMATSTPANANSPASISPVGPPPAITTGCSVIATLRPASHRAPRPSEGSPEPAVEIERGGQYVEVTRRAHRRRGVDERLYGDPRELPADADPLRAGLGDLSNRAEHRKRQDVDRPRDRLAYRPDLLDGLQAGRVEDVGPCPFEREQPLNRVLEVGVAPDVVLRPRREREWERQRARRLDGSCDPFDGVRAFVEVAGGIVVLDRPADRACLGDTLDRPRSVIRVGSEPVLEIDGDRKIRRVVECRRMRSDLVEARTSVATAEREREPRARGGERGEPETLEHARRTRVPRVRDHERLALVEGSQRGRLLSLGRHLSTLPRRGGPPCHAWREPRSARRPRARRRARTPNRPAAGSPRSPRARGSARAAPGSARRRSASPRFRRGCRPAPPRPKRTGHRCAGASRRRRPLARPPYRRPDRTARSPFRRGSRAPRARERVCPRRVRPRRRRARRTSEPAAFRDARRRRPPRSRAHARPPRVVRGRTTPATRSTRPAGATRLRHVRAPSASARESPMGRS